MFEIAMKHLNSCLKYNLSFYEHCKKSNTENFGKEQRSFLDNVGVKKFAWITVLFIYLFSISLAYKQEPIWVKSQKARKCILFKVQVDTMATIITFLRVWELILQPGVSIEQDFIMIHVLKVLQWSIKNHFLFSQTDRCVCVYWPIGPQRIGSREKWHHWLTNFKFKRLYAAYCICKTRVWKSESAKFPCCILI